MSAEIPAHSPAKRSKPPVRSGIKLLACVFFGGLVLGACSPEAIELKPGLLSATNTGGQAVAGASSVPAGGQGPATGGALSDSAWSGGTSSGGASSGGTGPNPLASSGGTSQSEDREPGTDGGDDREPGGEDGSSFPDSPDEPEYCDPDDDDFECNPGRYCDPEYHKCRNLCETNADCADQILRRTCESNGKCVECNSSAPCESQGRGHICDLSTGTCTGCYEDHHCVLSELGSACLERDGRGICGCERDSDCDKFEAEDRLRCSFAGVCVQCVNDGDCIEPTGECGFAGFCVECEEPDDCPANAPICTRGGICIECETSADCPQDTPQCEGSTGTCMECLRSEDCGEGMECRWQCEESAAEEDAVEWCEEGRYVCEPLSVDEF